MTNDNPSPTYRGFRRQSLYALSRVFDASLPQNGVVQPEGNEDVAVYNGKGELTEIIQVKDYSSPLVASHFKPSFYKRIAKYCKPDSSIKVSIVSFGPFGPVLDDAINDSDVISRASVKKTITQARAEKKPVDSLSDDDAENILNHLTLVKVDEEELRNGILEKLRHSLSGIDPEHSFQHLMWWLITASEDQVFITPSLAIEKIGSIGQFIAHRESHHLEWGRSIIPLISPQITGIDRLKSDFFQGGRVTFAHIEADLDVRRESILDAIQDAFKARNVVVIHSASGQGKTTLSYRYLKTCVPEKFRFEVLSPSDSQHARQMAHAIVGHAQAIEVPTIVYVDVRPGDIYWVEFVRQVASVNGVKVLVSTREEDWNLAKVSPTDFLYEEILLTFEESEAERIYSSLSRDVQSLRHLDFSDAWAQFGERKTLFEFVFFVTQETTIAQRIEHQLNSLSDEVNSGRRKKTELDLLRFVAVASAYETRLDLRKLLQICQLEDPRRTLQLFDQEYLLRVSSNGEFVEGFHSVRSEIIARFLTDPVFQTRSECAAKLIPFVVEEDLRTFLLCAFSRLPETNGEIFEALLSFQPSTWVGVEAIIVSLMWYGIEKYVTENVDLLLDVYGEVGASWSLMLDWDLAKFGTSWSIFNELVEAGIADAENAAGASAQFRQRQTDKQDVFSPALKWIEGIKEIPPIPASEEGFASLAAVTFWIGQLKARSVLQRTASSLNVLDSAFNMLHIQAFAHVAFGIQLVDPDVYADWLSRSRMTLLQRLRVEARIVFLEESTESLVAHYLLEIDIRKSRLGRRDADVDIEPTLHSLSIERARLLSLVLPGKDKYGAIGYGHRGFSPSGGYDESNQPGVIADVLRSQRTAELNALARGCAELRLRPDTWNDYIRQLHTIRNAILHALEDMTQACRATAGNQSTQKKLPLQNLQAWEDCKRAVRHSVLIPKSAVDEWGFVSESISGVSDRKFKNRFAIPRTVQLAQRVSHYLSSVRNFLDQSPTVLLLLREFQKARTFHQRKLLEAKAETLNLKPSLLRVSISNIVGAWERAAQMQRCFSSVSSNRSFPLVNDTFDLNEMEVLQALAVSWCSFAGALELKAVERNPSPNLKKLVLQDRFRSFLEPVRLRLDRTLSSLSSKGIQAAILSEETEWDGRRSLWIRIEGADPIRSLASIDLTWNALVKMFQELESYAAQLMVFRTYWSSIVVVPTVMGKSLEGLVLPLFGLSLNAEISANELYAYQVVAPEDTLETMGVDLWGSQPKWRTATALVSTYFELLHHLTHLADFLRLKHELDELGESITQAYLDQNIAYVRVLFQSTLDAYSKALEEFNEKSPTELAKPSIILCARLLQDLNDSILPVKDFDLELLMSVSAFAAWKDRLAGTIPQLIVAKCLLVADSLGVDVDLSQFEERQS